MLNLTSSLSVIATLLVWLLNIAPAAAQPLHASWVSGDGDDSNNCTRDKPCRSFKTALDNTVAGGEVRVLNHGTFGTFYIDKAISIVGDGVAGIIALKVKAGDKEVTQPAISIKAGATDVINLRGLILEGAEVGRNGIYFEKGAALHVQNCLIRGFRHIEQSAIQGWGIIFEPEGVSELYVSDTLVADNGGNLLSTESPMNGGGISIHPGKDGKAKVVLNRVQVENNVNGIKVSGVDGPVHVTVLDSVSAGNRGIGISIAGNTTKSAPNATVAIDRSAFVNNRAQGIYLYDDGQRVTLSNSVVAGNGGAGVRAIPPTGDVIDISPNNSISGNSPNIDAPACVPSDKVKWC
jgi:Right handed beta helix region